MGPERRPWILACVLAACGSSSARGRPARLVSPDVAVDQALRRAAQDADDGDYADAERRLARVVETSPGDPLADVARVSLARLRVARNDLDGAAALLARVPAGVDPSLAMRRSLVAGLVHARRAEVDAGLRALRPLAQRMIDRGDSAEADCAVAALEASARRPPEALLALARVESLAEGGVRWLPTGLPCDRSDDRAGAFRGLVADVAEPRPLADVLDALPPGHALRVDVARRLRAVAEARNEIPRWLRWLADLPDTEATLRVVRDEGVAPLRVGVLGPTAGARAVLGTALVRAVQIALEDQRAVEIQAEDEGASPEEAAAAFDRLAAGRPAAVIGPALEDHAAAVAARAAAAGVELHVLAPHVDDERALGATAVAAGPPPGARGAALAAAVRARGTRVRWTAAPGAERSLFAGRVRTLLGIAGVAVADPVSLAPGELHLVLGPWGTEHRAVMAERAAAAPTRWVFDARSGPPGSPGVWVGLAATDDAGLARFHQRYCETTGAPPGELALLAYDAARALLARARNVPHAPAFPRPWQVRAAATADGDGPLAVTRRCAAAPAE